MLFCCAAKLRGEKLFRFSPSYNHYSAVWRVEVLHETDFQRLRAENAAGTAAYLKRVSKSLIWLTRAYAAQIKEFNQIIV